MDPFFVELNILRIKRRNFMKRFQKSIPQFIIGNCQIHPKALFHIFNS